ncbi:hypothetical protein [Plebeiibacterium marinum]|uniref:DUF3857 domain-containing protein n=1 Tax=Plebeiibacterium marinum TaxID=2992111 RepID=A0AAE3MDH2_9BACT|nr:hypothetical protein [Plebeiobacterium marinum]MCW3805611.1 hypothetical protein [Plebeiobacterium marinum]
MTKTFSLVAFCFFFFISTQFSSAKAPIKFGKVDIEDLKMTVYEPDTSAAAVVLCKYGFFNGNDYRFTTITRVKILKKSGVSLSEFSFPGKEDMQVRGKVYNLENGEVVEERLRNESIYKLKITEDYYRMKVALPNIKVGSIYDIETTQLLLPSEFAFQREIPVRYCELVLENTPEVEFRKRSRGYFPVMPQGDNAYVAKNVPAFKTESFMDSKENYISKFEFDILRVSFPGYFKGFTTSWEAVNKRLRSNSYFGGALTNGVGGLNAVKKEIEAKYSDPYDKMIAAYEAIKQVEWNEVESLFSTESHLGGVYKDKKANSAEINMMLYQLLQKLDVYALPVAISTRENGRLHQFYPSLEKLNYMFIRAKIGDKEYLLDATEKLMPADMLPLRCLNKTGRLINNESGTWIDLKTDKKDKSSSLYDLKLNENLEAEGTLKCKRFEYSAYDFRKQYKKYASEDEFLEAFEYEHPGLRVKDCTLTNLDSIYKPVSEDYTIKVSNLTQQVGEMIMINPFVFDKVESNPFKMEERKYPVDFAYKREKLVMFNLTIPDGYGFDAVPKPTRILLPEKSGSVLINYSVLGNKLSVTYVMKIDKAIFTSEEYAYLKHLYALVIEKHAEPVIIKKSQDAASL